MKKSYPAKLENLGAIAADIESFCASNGLEDMCFQINLCVEEVFANCVEYGYSKDSSKSVEIEIAKRENCVEIFVRDTAPAFNPLSDVAPPDLTSNIEDRKVGGLGVFFLRKNMDRLSYRRVGGVNELMMVKNMHPK